MTVFDEPDEPLWSGALTQRLLHQEAEASIALDKGDMQTITLDEALTPYDGAPRLGTLVPTPAKRGPRKPTPVEGPCVDKSRR